MPWCCGLANTDGATSTALITSDNDNFVQQSLNATEIAARQKSQIVSDNFGPMLLQPKKTVSLVSFFF